jgi:hypothetical protein
LIHHATGFKADVYIAFDELHHWALANRRTLELDGATIAVAPVEYVIVRKLEYFREGRSEKHVRDIRSMLEVSAETIDRDALDRWIARRDLSTEWAEVTSDR